MSYFVYEIVIDGVRRYIGMTDNLKRRQSQHRRDYIKGKDKYLYKQIRLSAPQSEITLNTIKEFTNKGDCKRYEAYLILKDYFSNKNLWQSFPVSIKYF